MNILFQKNAWEDYLYWQATDKNILKKINELIKDCARNPFDGIGKPEALRNNFSGFWSRRITDEHRLIYTVVDDNIHIIKCRFHF